VKYLLLGTGARCNALSRYLRRDDSAAVWRYPETTLGSEDSVAPAFSNEALANWSKEVGVGLVIPLSEQYLFSKSMGHFAELGIPVLGPGAEAGNLERSKRFGKLMMARAGIPTPTFESSEGFVSAREYVSRRTVFPMVIKEDTTSGGPGVFISFNKEDAFAALDRMEETANPNATILFEEFVVGYEYTRWAFTDGLDFHLMPRIREYKRRAEGHLGDFTGGMGAVAPWPFPGPKLHEGFDSDAVKRILNILRKRRVNYRGLLVLNVIVSSDGPQIVEFNCHWGDPETQVVLGCIQGDLGRFLSNLATGTLDSGPSLSVTGDVSIWITLAELGYPNQRTGKSNELNDFSNEPHTLIYGHSSREYTQKARRVVSIGAVAPTLEQARMEAYERIRGFMSHCETELVYRSDIGC
jgi:phosphoribosylamine--glycine ligase